MKRLGKGLYERIISLENLRLAVVRSQEGKSGRKEIQAFNEHAEELILKLHDTLLTGTFKTSQYRHFKVTEPKERTISALPYYPDRIVHHAIMNVLEPVWKRTFTHNTFACIKGRGINACRRYIRRIIDGYKRGSKPCYCLKMDIRRFYPSIDGGTLKGIVRKRIKDARTLALIDEIIDSAKGLPIGNYVSQYMANLYLAYLMHGMTDIVRVECSEYSDDMVFFSSSKARLHALFKEIIEPYITDELGMTVKGDYQVFPVAANRYDKHGRALDYVGYTFYMEHTGLRKRTKKRFARRVARMRKQGISGKRLAVKASSWTGWCKHAECRNLVRTVMKQETKFVKYMSNQKTA